MCGEAMIDTYSASGATLRLRSTGLSCASATCLRGFPCEAVGQLDRPRYIADPWHEPELADIPAEAPVAIIGTGLTAVDVVLSLLDQEHKGPIMALSRRGLLPQRHEETRRYPDFMADEPAPESLSRLFARLRTEVRKAEAGGFDWRSVIDAFRPHTERCWRALPEAEQRRFLRHVRPYWDIHRHRMAPQAAERLWDAFRRGQLVRRKGRLMAIAEDGADLVLSYRSRDGRMHHLRAAHVINSSGPQFDVSRLDHPLLASALQQGLARPDPLGLGLEVTPDFQLVGRDGESSPGLLALGPIALGGCLDANLPGSLRAKLRSAASPVRPCSAYVPINGRALWQQGERIPRVGEGLPAVENDGRGASSERSIVHPASKLAAVARAARSLELVTLHLHSPPHALDTLGIAAGPQEARADRGGGSLPEPPDCAEL